MGRRHSIGLELNTVANGMEFATGGGTISAVTFRSGLYALRISSLTSGVARAVRVVTTGSPSLTKHFVRGYLNITTFPSAENRILSYGGNTNSNIVWITLDDTGVLRLYDEDGVIGSPSSALSTGVWYRIETLLDKTLSSGSHVVTGRIDGVDFATASDRAVATAAGSSVWFGGNCALEANTQGEWFWDDLAVNDGTGSFQNSWCGSGQIVYLRPNAAGDNAQWTPTAGNNWENVEELPPDDVTTIVSSNTLDQIDDYNLGASPSDVGTVNVVHVGTRHSGAAASANASFVTRIKASSGGTVEESAAMTPGSTSWAGSASVLSMTLYDLPGASTGGYTKAALDDTQIGVRISTGNTNAVRLSAIWLAVDYLPIDYEDGVGASDGIATASGVGAGIISSDAAASGIAIGAGVGESITEAIAASTGVATASAAGESTVESVGASAGVATGAGVGESTAEAVGTSAGVATAAFVSDTTVSGVASAAGIATVTGIAAAIASGAFSAAGAATALAVGEEAIPSRYSTHAQFTGLPNVADMCLTIICPREPFDPYNDPLTWTLESGNCYWTEYPIYDDEVWSVWAVYEDNVEITPVATKAACIATPGSWYYDIDAQRKMYIHRSDSGDPNDNEILIQIAPIIAKSTHTPPTELWAPIFDLSSIKSIIARRVIFEPHLSAQGLSSIGSSLETGYYGVSVPSLRHIEIINVDRLWDKYPDRFQWRDAVCRLYHGDGGAVLDIDEHWYMDEFRIIDCVAGSPTAKINFNSGASALIRKVPTEFFANDSNFRLEYKPFLLGGPVEGLETYLQSAREFGVMGHFMYVLAVEVNDVVEDPSHYDVLTSDNQTIIRFGTAFIPTGDPPKVIVKGTRSVDINGTAFNGEQLPGAALRYILNYLGRTPLSELPAASFSAIDASYPFHMKILVRGGDERETLTDVAAQWTRSMFAWLRRVRGIWEAYRYNPASLRASSANVYEDDFITAPTKGSGSDNVYERAHVGFAKDVSLQESKIIWAEHPSAKRLHQVLERLELDPTYLYKEEHAQQLLDLLVDTRSMPFKPIAFTAVGEVFRSDPGDIITAWRRRAPDVTGAWVAKKLLVVSMEKHTLDLPLGVDIVAIEPYQTTVNTSAVTIGPTITSIEGESIAAAGSDGDDHTCDTGTTVLIFQICFRPDDGNLVAAPDSVTFNGTSATLVGISDDGLERVAVYKQTTNLDAGGSAHAFAVSFDDDVSTYQITLVNVIGATQVLNFTSKKQLETSEATRKVDISVPSQTGDLILVAHGLNQGVLDTSVAVGPGQTRIWNKRSDFSGAYDVDDSSRGTGSTKPGASGSTAIQCIDEINRGRTQAVAAVALRA